MQLIKKHKFAWTEHWFYFQRIRSRGVFAWTGITMLFVFAQIAQSRMLKATETPPSLVMNKAANAADDDAEDEETGERKFYTQPITVSGRAIDEDGEPIADAKIYLISARTDSKRLAETISDADGRYEFKDIPLPIEPAQQNSGRKDHGAFELFGIKAGKAFAWRPLKWYFTTDRDRPDPEMLFVDVPSRFFADDPIVLDLRFGEPCTIRGRILDDMGKPLGGVRVSLGDCQILRDDFQIKQGRTDEPLTAFHQPGCLPDAIKTRSTDGDGRFEFTELPKECLFSFTSYLAGYSYESFYAATSERKIPMLGGHSKIHNEGVFLRLAKTVEVRLRVVYGDTGLPAPNVYVSMNGTHKDTDEDGIAVLELPPGTYNAQSLLPARGTRYLATELVERVVVTRDSSKEPTTLKLNPACELDVTIVDAETGKPISDSDLWMSEVTSEKTRKGVQFVSWKAPVVFYERPKSNRDGKLRVLVEPGEHRFGVGDDFRPEGYEADETGQLVDCPAGKTIEVSFKLKMERGRPRLHGTR